MVLGTGQVASRLLSNEQENSFIKISNIDLWKEPILIKDMLRSLDFIRNKEKWGGYLQGGVVWLNDNDFNSIISYKNATAVDHQ